VTKLQARVNTVLESLALQQDSATVVTTILREIKMLDISIDGWSETVEGWQPIPIIDKSPDYAFADILAVHSYTSLTVFLHHIMKFVAQMRLHEGALRLLQAHLQGQDQTSLSMPEKVNATSWIIAGHIKVIRQNISDFLGSIAYGLGDVDEHGKLITNTNQRLASRRAPAAHSEGSKLRSMEIFVPLSAVQHSQYLDSRQRTASGIVLQRIQDEFRTR